MNNTEQNILKEIEELKRKLCYKLANYTERNYVKTKFIDSLNKLQELSTQLAQKETAEKVEKLKEELCMTNNFHLNKSNELIIDKIFKDNTKKEAEE